MSLADRYSMLALRNRAANDNEPKLTRIPRLIAEVETAIFAFRRPKIAG